MPLGISQFMSLDGVVQAPGGAEEDTDGGFAHGGWSMPYFDPEIMGGFVDAAMADTDALLFGRRTWQTMAAHWPERADDGDPFTTQINRIAKYVVSSSLTQDELQWANSTLVPGDDAAAAVRELKDGLDGVLGVMGSAQLTRTLIASGLVDEYRLMIEPVLLGGGKAAFPADGEKRPLELVETTIARSGVLCCVYRPGETPPSPHGEG
jgi:dihydrofolate reductase